MSNVVESFIKHCGGSSPCFGTEETLKKISKETKQVRDAIVHKLALFFLYCFVDTKFPWPSNPLQKKIDSLKTSYQAVFEAIEKQELNINHQAIKPFYLGYSNRCAKETVIKEHAIVALSVNASVRSFLEFYPYITLSQKKDLESKDYTKELIDYFDGNSKLKTNNLGSFFYGKIALYRTGKPIGWFEFITEWVSRLEKEKSKNETKLEGLKKMIPYSFVFPKQLEKKPAVTHSLSLQAYLIEETIEQLELFLDCKFEENDLKTFREILKNEAFRRNVIFHIANPQTLYVTKKPLLPLYKKNEKKKEEILPFYLLIANCSFELKWKNIPMNEQVKRLEHFYQMLLTKIQQGKLEKENFSAKTFYSNIFEEKNKKIDDLNTEIISTISTEENITLAFALDAACRSFPEYVSYIPEENKKKLKVDVDLQKLFELNEPNPEFFFGHVALYQNGRPLSWYEASLEFATHSKNKKNLYLSIIEKIKAKTTFNWLLKEDEVKDAKKHALTFKEYIVEKTINELEHFLWKKFELNERKPYETEFQNETRRKEITYYLGNPKHLLDYDEKDDLLLEMQEAAFLKEISGDAEMKLSIETEKMIKLKLKEKMLRKTLCEHFLGKKTDWENTIIQASKAFKYHSEYPPIKNLRPQFLDWLLKQSNLEDLALGFGAKTQYSTKIAFAESLSQKLKDVFPNIEEFEEENENLLVDLKI